MSNSMYRVNITTPFTYHITFRQTGQVYYGVRYAKGCSPDDLWETYFTSSEEIKDLVKVHGKESFIVFVDRIFNSIQEAVDYETYYLKLFDDKNNPHFFNRNNGDGKFVMYGKWSESHRKNHKTACSHPRTEETKRKISESQKGKIIPLEVRKTISKTLTGRTLSVGHKEKISKTLTGRTLSVGHVDMIREHAKVNYAKNNMSEKLSDGRRKSEKWKKSVTSEEYKLKKTLLDPRSKTVTINGKDYPSIRNAAKSLGISYTRLRGLLKGKNNIILQ